MTGGGGARANHTSGKVTVPVTTAETGERIEPCQDVQLLTGEYNHTPHSYSTTIHLDVLVDTDVRALNCECECVCTCVCVCVCVHTRTCK